MAKSNRDKIGEALEVLRDGLYPFIERELKAHFGKDWKKQATDDMRHTPRDNEWDASLLLNVMWNHWNVVFRNTLGHGERSLVSLTRDVRNAWAHQKTFSSDDTYRALDQMSQLLASVSAGEQAVELDKQKMEVMRLKLSEQTRSDARKRAGEATEGKPASGLSPWRDIIEPHDDVASGNYQQAEFAADLYQVWKGIAMPEYGDPVEFFRRTYLTEGLRDLLTNAIKRLAHKQGDPVVALQTNFGGGKTHSILALYHLFDPEVKGGDLPNVDELLAKLGVSELPKVQRAVLVGQYVSPGKVHKMPDGTKVSTLWGELAWQLGGKKGYKFVEEADKTGTNPGEGLVELFLSVGPCMVLIDEWIAYARQLYEKHDLPAGSFDTQFTFAQALTEAAAAAKHALIVVSVPSSDIETGGRAGREALNRLENVVARKDAPWQPASAEEGFEIVRRRLFKPIASEDLFRERDNVIRTFIENYRANSKEFPVDAGSAEYEKRMRSAYPIHPDVFDRLYLDWSTLDRFQRTRGVLRFMAAVIHELWEKQDRNLLILPGMIPIDESAVRKELTRYLEPTWSAVVEADVDGPDSTPLAIDRENSTLGRYSATRRVARTIFLGTAPLHGTANRGKGIQQINLGCVQPGESVNTFGDALRRLQNKATYLNTDGELTYYDTAQNINRDAESRKAGFSDDDVAYAIREALKKQESRRGDFARVHACPQSPSDVTDDRDARLVILGPESEHLANKDDSPAIDAAKELLASRGTGPRIYRNTLAFVAADRTRLTELQDAVRWALAWAAIDNKKDDLDLNQSQIRTVVAKRREWEGVVEQRIPETYCWLIVPGQSDPHADVEWHARRLSGQEPLAGRASKKMRTDELLIPQLGAVRLRMELDRVPLWRGDDVEVRQLAEDFAQYLYLPRLTGPAVLIDAIADGVNLLTWRSEAFAYAESKSDEGRYAGLRCGENVRPVLDGSALLVKGDVAAAQRERDVAKQQGVSGEPGDGPIGAESGATAAPTTTGDAGDAVSTEPAAPRRFYGSVALDSKRLGRDAGRIAEEVVAHLAGIKGAQVRITLEIEADVPEGVDHAIVRAVSENCRTLSFNSHGFERE